MLPLIVGKEPKSVTAEAYRTLRTNLQFRIMDKGIKKIIVTSAEPGEGKSITVCNLALSMYQSGKKVLIIDCDMRKPSINKYFDLENENGFVNLIMESLDYKKVIKKHYENLHVITAGKAPINPAELLNVDYLAPVFKELEADYDIIFIDTPPVVSVTDAQLLASVADGTIMVLSSGESHKKLCQKALQLLSNVNANIIGAVLNKATEESGAYSSRSRYLYYGQHASSKKTRRMGKNETVL